MMALQTKTFAQVVQDAATAVQGSVANFLTDFSVGSILRSIVEATGATAMWLQGLILQLLTTTRAATSSGADLDSWMADFGLARLPAVQATGEVTFARFTPGAQAIVPVGSIVQTADGTQQFTVLADTAQEAYNPALFGYVLPVSTASVTATVEALTAGTGANVAIGVISTLAQSIAGVDTVTNGAAFVTGEAAESDAALRIRFTNYIASLEKGTPAAIRYAVSAMQQGLTVSLVEDLDYAGNSKPGYFYVVVDDGTGTPSDGLLSAVGTAIEAVRAVGVTYGVFAPVVVTANVAATITTSSGYTHSVVASAVAAAVSAYVQAVPLGGSLFWNRLFQVAYDASPGVIEVTALTVNSGTSDINATAKQAIVPGSVVVT